jgi:outer membrane protein assembly factor BamD (BamD/ComL family)
MRKIIPLTFLVSLFLLTGRAFGAASAQFEQAETYKQNKQYELAEAIYKDIAANLPGTDEALQARTNLAILYSKMGDHMHPAAKKEADALIADFADHPELPAEVYNIAEQFWRRKRYEDVKLLCEYIVKNHSDSDLAIKARASVVGADILLGKDEAAQAGIDRFIADFAGHPELAGNIYRFAEQYWNTKRYEDAKPLYEYIAQTCPDSAFAIKAKALLVKAEIMLGKDEAAKAAFDRLVTDFADNPELPAEVYNLAEQYWNMEKYENVKPLYEYIAQNHTGSDLAIKSRTWVARADLMLGNDQAAKAGFDRLIADFAGNPELPAEIYKIEAQYWHMKRFDDVKRICEYIAQNHPNSDFAIKARASVAAADLLLGNDEAAQAGIDAVIKNFAKDPELAETLWKLGNVSKDQGKYDLSRRLWQRTFETDPQGPLAMQAKAGVAEMDILLGNDEVVHVIIDGLIADFAENPELPEAVFKIGHKYYTQARVKGIESGGSPEKEDLRKAIAVWERIIQELPASKTTPEAHYTAAVCYSQELGEYAKGIAYFQTIVDNWPQYKYAWHAQYFVGMYTERLKESGLMEAAEADPLIEKAYKAVVENYPHSESAPSAALELAEIYSDKSLFAESERYYEFYLDKEKSECACGRALNSAYNLAQRAEKEEGGLDTAAGLYNLVLAFVDEGDPLAEKATAGLARTLKTMEVE